MCVNCNRFANSPAALNNPSYAKPIGVLHLLFKLFGKPRISNKISFFRRHQQSTFIAGKAGQISDVGGIGNKKAIQFLIQNPVPAMSSIDPSKSLLFDVCPNFETKMPRFTGTLSIFIQQLLPDKPKPSSYHGRSVRT